MKQISKYLSILIAFLLLSRLFYLRVFRAGTFREIPQNLYENENYLRLAIYIYIFGLFLFLFYLNLKLVLNIEPKYDLNWIKQIADWYRNLFYQLYWFLGSFLPANFLVNTLSSFGVFLCRYFDNCTKRYVWLFLLHIIPKYVFLLIFIGDIFIFHCFCYIYYWSFLLLIPFLSNLLLKLFDCFWRINIKDINEVLEVVHLETGKTITMFENFVRVSKTELRIKKDYGYRLSVHYVKEQIEIDQQSTSRFLYDETLDMFIKRFGKILYPIGIMIHIYQYDYDRFTKYSQLFLYFNYILLWGYIIYHCF